MSMQSPARYLIVDGHSIIFGWPELRKLHARRSSLAREALLKRLRDYQDWTGVHVVVVFDGKGKKVDATSDPAEVQVFYSRTGQSADAIIERLASKYAKRFELMVATSDLMEAETVQACGAEWISPDGLHGLLVSNGRRIERIHGHSGRSRGILPLNRWSSSTGSFDSASLRSR